MSCAVLSVVQSFSIKMVYVILAMVLRFKDGYVGIVVIGLVKSLLRIVRQLIEAMHIRRQF